MNNSDKLIADLKKKRMKICTSISSSLGSAAIRGAWNHGPFGHDRNPSETASKARKGGGEGLWGMVLSQHTDGEEQCYLKKRLGQTPNWPSVWSIFYLHHSCEAGRAQITEPCSVRAGKDLRNHLIQQLIDYIHCCR